MTDIQIHQIKIEDLEKGFLNTLDSLRQASDMAQSKAKGILEKIKENPNHIIFVAEQDSKIIGATTLFIEPKFIHDGGMVGHIEDVVVDKKHQGSGVGKMLVQVATKYAQDSGCYKTVLDCTDELVPFYEKLGFYHHSNTMRLDH